MRTRTIRLSRGLQRVVRARCSSASTTLDARAPASSTPPTRSTAFAAVIPIATTRRTSDISARIAARRAATHGHRSTSLAREIEPDGLDGVSFELHAPDGSLRVRLAVPGLYNVYNALAAASLALSLGVALDDVVAGLERFQAAFGRFERFSVGDRGFLLLLVKNPAGANEALRTLEEGGVPPALVVALNDRIADGRDVSWIWDVDFEPVLEGAEHIVVSGERAAELALRFTYAGFPRERLELVSDLQAALDRGLELTPHWRRARRPPDLHRDARAAGDRNGARAHATVLGTRRTMIIRVGHLYPEYLNIYADRGNIAVFTRRAAARGHELRVDPVTLDTPLEPGSHDLLYVGGGQDREQAMIAPDLAARGDTIRAAVEGGAALLAVCGGYQLLGRGYRGRDGSWLEGAGLFPHETLAGETRMIGDVLLESTLDEAPGRTIAGFENHAGRTVLDPGAKPARTGRRGIRERRRLRLRRLSRRPRGGHLPSRPAPATQPLARRPAALLGRRPCDRRGSGGPRPAPRRARGGGSCRRRRPRTKPRREARLTRYSAQRAPR